MRASFFIFSLLIAFPLMGWAQIGETPTEEELPEDTTPLQRAVGLKRAEMQRLMDMQLAEIDRVCSLTSEQSVRLRLAAKGSVEKCVDAWTNEIHENGWLNMAGQVDEQIVDQWLASMAGEHVADEVLRQPLWIDARNTVLNESQMQKFNKALAERIALRRKAVVDQAVVTLEMELLLSPEQCTLMRKVVDAEMGERLGVHGRGPKSAPEFTKHLSRDKVKAVLTEAQFLRWEDLTKQAEYSDYDDWDGGMHFFQQGDEPQF